MKYLTQVCWFCLSTNYVTLFKCMLRNDVNLQNKRLKQKQQLKLTKTKPIAPFLNCLNIHFKFVSLLNEYNKIYSNYNARILRAPRYHRPQDAVMPAVTNRLPAQTAPESLQESTSSNSSWPRVPGIVSQRTAASPRAARNFNQSSGTKIRTKLTQKRVSILRREKSKRC